MMPLLAALAATAQNVIYSLSDGSITGNEASSATATADLIFLSDGGLDKFQSTPAGGSTSQFKAAEWSLIEPSEIDSSNWHCRLVSHDTGTNRYVGTPTLGTWTVLSSDITFDFSWSPGVGPQGPDVSTYTFALSNDGGSTTHDTMTLTVNLSIESP